jgi:hypothetical protein
VGVVSILFVLPGLRYSLPPEPPQDDHEALLGELDAFIAERRRLDLGAAKIFNAIAQLGIHLYEGASSVASLAEARGLSGASAHEIELLGRALWQRPLDPIEADVASGRIRIENAAVLGRFDADDDLLRQGDRWLEWARTLRPREFLRKYRERVDEVRQGRPVRALTVFLSHEGMDDFEAARRVASRSARIGLTAGQTVDVLVDEYLERHHPLYQRAGLGERAGARRAADTATDLETTPGSRYISLEVRRAVLRRNGDRCAVPFCHRDTFVHFSHRRPHRRGGSREADNLDLLCDRHHALFEQGLIRIEGTPDAPVFKTPLGRVVGEDGFDTDFLDADLAEAREERLREEERAAAAAAREAARAEAIRTQVATQEDAAASRAGGASTSSESAPPRACAAGPPGAEAG